MRAAPLSRPDADAPDPDGYSPSRWVSERKCGGTSSLAILTRSHRRSTSARVPKRAVGGDRRELSSDGRSYRFLGLGGSVATYVRALSTHTAACSVVQDGGNDR